MESSDFLNGAFRVKEEPFDVSLIENNYGMIDEKPNLETFQPLPYLRENSVNIDTLRKCDLNHKSEFDENVEIVAECEDVKPNISSLKVEKIDNDFQNHLQNLRWSDDCKTENIIKIEPMDEVKQEYFNDDAEQLNLNLDYDSIKQNKKRRIGKKFKNEYRPKSHIVAGHSDTTYACEVCGKKFSSKGNLKKHVESSHLRITHSCDVCGKTFSLKENLKRHIDSMHDNITHTCDICGKTFTQKGHLKVHIDTLHYSITHVCDICGKTFKHKSSFKTHIDAIHNDIKYTCGICAKVFPRKSNLKAHIDWVHNSEHSCDTCGKKFTEKSSLRVHIVAKHSGVTQKCDICGNKYTRKSSLQRHLSRVHMRNISKIKSMRCLTYSCHMSNSSIHLK